MRKSVGRSGHSLERRLVDQAVLVGVDDRQRIAPTRREKHGRESLGPDEDDGRSARASSTRRGAGRLRRRGVVSPLERSRETLAVARRATARPGGAAFLRATCPSRSSSPRRPRRTTNEAASTAAHMYARARRLAGAAARSSTTRRPRRPRERDVMEVRGRRAAEEVRERDGSEGGGACRRGDRPVVSQPYRAREREERRQRDDVERTDEIAGRPRRDQQRAESAHRVERDEAQVFRPPWPVAGEQQHEGARRADRHEAGDDRGGDALRDHQAALAPRLGRVETRTPSIAAYAARAYTKVSALQTAATPTVRSIVASRRRRCSVERARSVPARITTQGRPKRSGPVLGYAMTGRPPARFATSATPSPSTATS